MGYIHVHSVEKGEISSFIADLRNKGFSAYFIRMRLEHKYPFVLKEYYFLDVRVNVIG